MSAAGAAKYLVISLSFSTRRRFMLLVYPSFHAIQVTWGVGLIGLWHRVFILLHDSLDGMLDVREMVWLPVSGLAVIHLERWRSRISTIISSMSTQTNRCVVPWIENQRGCVHVGPSLSAAVAHLAAGRLDGVLENTLHVEALPPLATSTLLQCMQLAFLDVAWSSALTK